MYYPLYVIGIVALDHVDVSAKRIGTGSRVEMIRRSVIDVSVAVADDGVGVASAIFLQGIGYDIGNVEIVADIVVGLGTSHLNREVETFPFQFHPNLHFRHRLH